MSCLKGVQRLLYKLYNITHTKYCMACSIGYILYNLYDKSRILYLGLYHRPFFWY